MHGSDGDSGGGENEGGSGVGGQAHSHAASKIVDPAPLASGRPLGMAWDTGESCAKQSVLDWVG